VTSYITYQRGLGGFQFSAAQIDQLSSLLSQLNTAMQTDRKYDTGLGGDVYRAVRDMVSGPSGPKAGVNISVWSWIDGAAKVNAADGFYAAFIRDYTATQFHLRGLPASVTPEQLNQRASNNIALNLVKDIVSKGTLPGIQGLGAIDAGAAASDVFSHAGIQEYAPWAGTLLFPFLGDQKFYRDLLLNQDTVVATVPKIDEFGTTTLQIKYATGTYDLIASLEATELAAESAGFANITEALANLFGARGAPFPNQAALAKETTVWFNDYYGLPSGTPRRCRPRLSQMRQAHPARLAGRKGLGRHMGTA